MLVCILICLSLVALELKVKVVCLTFSTESTVVVFININYFLPSIIGTLQHFRDKIFLNVKKTTSYVIYDVVCNSIHIQGSNTTNMYSKIKKYVRH